MNLKTALRRGLWFVNVGSALTAMATSRIRRDRVFMVFEGRSYTYAEVLEQSRRYAALFSAVRRARIAAGKLARGEQLAIGACMENTPEFVFAVFGAALSGDVVFGINTGFRGETLIRVVEQASLGILLADRAALANIEPALPQVTCLGKDDVLLVGEPAGVAGLRRVEDALDAVPSGPLAAPDPIDNFGPLLVIYTSGTTGLPKGVPCAHIKLLGAGVITWQRLGLRRRDRGYVCMPLFHSNAWLLGIFPMMVAGGSFVLKRRFSASAFEGDLLEHGITYLNYVGQPLHYVLEALEKKYGSGAAVVAALAKHPKNRFRIAHGNGAPSVDREKMIRYLGMEHVYELYGSTEAPITTLLRPGEPHESVGRITSKDIVILNARGHVCPPARVDAKGHVLNYDEAVGEISKKMGKDDNIFFDGYYKNQDATQKKFKDGYYRSGDLGYVRLVGRKRFLYFSGRTDDWIRKDGENFSAESVMQIVQRHPGVALVAVYGVPAEVSDEKVMVALQLKAGERFDPKTSFDWFKMQQSAGLDPKWMPDYVRIVDALPMTETQKVLCRPLKREGFNVVRSPEMRVYFRERGDETYRQLTREAYAQIEAKFVEAGRAELLERY